MRAGHRDRQRPCTTPPSTAQCAAEWRR
jgi:hypothetical protein